MSERTWIAPSFPNKIAVDLPIPDAAPVKTTILSFTLILVHLYFAKFPLLI
jgi:hypothetical protein